MEICQKNGQLFETHSFTNTLGMACSLKKHVKTMHEDGNSYIIDTCPVCSKHFKYKTALENHMKKVHHSSLPNEPQEYRLVCPEFWSLEELTLRFLLYLL